MATTTNPLLTIKTPQLIGICCGVAVFVSTIITVAILFAKGGSIDDRERSDGEQPSARRSWWMSCSRPRKLPLSTSRARTSTSPLNEEGRGATARRRPTADDDDARRPRAAAWSRRRRVAEAGEKSRSSRSSLDHRRDLAIRIDNTKTRTKPSRRSRSSRVDALVQRGYRRIAWRVLEPTDAALAGGARLAPRASCASTASRTV